MLHAWTQPVDLFRDVSPEGPPPPVKCAPFRGYIWAVQPLFCRAWCGAFAAAAPLPLKVGQDGRFWNVFEKQRWTPSLDPWRAWR